jgi:hypothetical protein
MYQVHTDYVNKIKVYDNGTYINTVTVFVDIIHHPVLYLKQRFGDWILSLSSGKNLLSWAQSVKLVFLQNWFQPLLRGVTSI